MCRSMARSVSTRGVCDVKLPDEPRSYLGIALVVAIAALSFGGVVAAVQGNGPTPEMLTVIGTIVGALIGGLVGHEIGRRDGSE